MDWNKILKRIDENRWMIEKSYKPGMRVDGIIYANDALMKLLEKEEAVQQVANVAFLPGIVKYSLAMPDIHWGYGFPIGGVAAMREADGVISPGGIGYDINCLSGDSQVLHSLGYSLPIKDFGKIYLNERIRCFDFKGENLEDTSIVYFLKRFSKSKVYKITTSTGLTLTATEDHPFYTKDGMVPVGKINKGQDVAVYPFKGVPFEKPSDEVVVDEDKIKKAQILNQLKRRNLLPLKYDSDKLPYLIKIMGYVFGDGNIHFTKKKGKGITSFYGKPEDLEEIRNDIASIGYKPSRVYSRGRSHKLKTLYADYEFNTVETSFSVRSSSFAVLLAVLGAPVGNKAEQNYNIPEFLFNAPLWQKRLFLASFFGALLSTPKTMKGHGYNFYCNILSLNKKEKYAKSGREFLSKIASLLKEFDVNINKVSQRFGYVNKNKIKSYCLRLIISAKPEDLINLYSKIGFEYNKRRRFFANAAVQFLKIKQLIIEEREEIALKACQLKEKTGVGARSIYEQVNSPWVNLRFIERSIYEGRKTSSRISCDFISFDKFIKDYTEGLGQAGMVWDKIISKEEIKFNDYVYDFTVKHKHHNFIANNFVVSNCGVRLLRTNLKRDELKEKLKPLIDQIFNDVPCGVGREGRVPVKNPQELKKVLKEGANWAVQHGYGLAEDLICTESGGCMGEADPDKVSQEAVKRGINQLGTLGAGNHFLEVQEVSEIYDEKTACAFGIFKGQITILIHCGSRGLGHQVCTDYLRVMGRSVGKYGISLPDRQLACAPIKSPEGKDYFSAMCASANFAWTNRQCIVHFVREAFEKVFKTSHESLGIEQVYDVAHNIAKFERHEVDGKNQIVCVHRKGATRAYPAGFAELPDKYRQTGQPVLVPGDMGRCSFLLVGTQGALQQSFASTCHGAGRVMSRHDAKKIIRGRDLESQLAQKGIYVRTASYSTLAEEAPDAYKNVVDVVEVCHNAGISKKVAKMKPLGVVKG